jgi:outer membrane protein assembly factor BamB
LHPDKKGEVIWQKQFNQACSGLALGQDRLYVTLADSGHVYCLGSSSGDQVWDASLGTRNLSAPTLGGAMLYVGSDHYLYAVASDSGTVRWRVPSRGTFSAPAVADGTVYADSTDNMLYAIDATKGAVNWAFDAGAAVHARPAIVDGSVFFGNTNHAFYAIKASSGKPVWQSRLSGAVSTWPTAANGLIYVASDVDLFALDATTGAAPDVIAAQAPTSTVPQGAADVVKAYYAAVNAKDFRSAWEWGGKHLRPPYQSFVAGYAHTVSVGLQISQVHGAVVAVRISSVEDDGTVKVYEGTYTVSGDSIVSAAISEVSSSRTP